MGMTGIMEIILILLVGVLLGFLMISLHFIEMVKIAKEQTDIIRAILLYLLSE